MALSIVKRAAILTDLHEGVWPHKVIAQRHKVSNSTICRLAKLVGVTPPARKYNPNRLWPTWATERAKEPKVGTTLALDDVRRIRRKRKKE